MKPLAMLVAVCAFGADPTVLVTPAGLRVGVMGPKPASPGAVVFFFGGEIVDSLTQQRFRDGQAALGANAIPVSIDLPGHGADQRPGEPGGLKTWRTRTESGEDIVAYTATRASAALDWLVREGYADGRRVAAFGTSRGGFMALHWAAADPRVSAVAAFAPVTDLMELTEFAGMKDDHRARALSTHRIADKLSGRRVWMVIGSADHRVSTERAIQFLQRLVEHAEASGRKPLAELHIVASPGHTIPDNSYPEAARWLLRGW